jgi:hypothetical protein
VDRIAQVMEAPTTWFVRVLGTLGLRYGEGAALRRRSVDLLRRRLVIEESWPRSGPNSSSDRRRPMP